MTCWGVVFWVLWSALLAIALFVGIPAEKERLREARNER